MFWNWFTSQEKEKAPDISPVTPDEERYQDRNDRALTMLHVYAAVYKDEDQRQWAVDQVLRCLTGYYKEPGGEERYTQEVRNLRGTASRYQKIPVEQIQWDEGVCP